MNFDELFMQIESDCNIHKKSITKGAKRFADRVDKLIDKVDEDFDNKLISNLKRERKLNNKGVYTEKQLKKAVEEWTK
jgi:hypothetical protein